MAFVPKSVATDDNYKVWWVPTIADPTKPTVGEIEAGVDLTYSFTSDGFARSGDQDAVTDDRLALGVTLNAPGKKSATLDLTIILNPASPEDDIARTTLVDGAEGFFVTRAGVPYVDAVAVGDKVSPIPTTIGGVKNDNHEAGAIQTLNIGAFVTAPIQDFVSVVAGA